MKKKVLLIGSIPPPTHGTNIYYQYLIKSRIKEEFDVIQLNISDGRSELDNLGKFDIINIYYSLKNLYKLFIILLKKKPVIVYLMPSSGNAYLRDGLFIYFSDFFSNSKIIAHFHASDFPNYYERSNIFLKYFIRGTIQKINSILVLGEKIKQDFLVIFGVNNVIVIPNGSDFDILPNFNTNEKVQLLYFGNMFKYKGIFNVVNATKILLNNGFDIELKIGGKYGYDPIYKMTHKEIKNALENEIKGEKNISILGPLHNNDKEDIFINSDIFLYPTINDGFPLVILEAMSAGLPVITTSVGAIPEVVIDGVTGIILKENLPEELAKSIQFLINNPEKRIEMGKGGRKRYEEKYTLEHNINNLINVFKNILEDKI